MTEPSKPKPAEPILIGGRVKIYPRGKKKIYCADFWSDGKHHRRTLQTRNLKIARQKALQLEARLMAGSYQSTPPPMPISEAIKLYFTHLETENRRPMTIAKYNGILGGFCEFAEKNNVFHLSQVTLPLLDKYLASRKPETEPISRYNEVIAIKIFFKWTKQRKYIRENPLAEAKCRKPRLESRGGPTQAEVERALMKAKARHDPRLSQYMVIAYTGMRSGDLRRLLVEDIDLENNWLHVVSRPGEETKSGLSRKIPIHAKLKPFLEKQLQLNAGPRLFTDPPSKKCPQGGRRIDTGELNKDFRSLLTAVGVAAGRKTGGFSIHSLRNSFETICVNAGIPQRAVDTWLDHHSDRSMASIYYKLPDEDSQRFMLKVPLGTGIPAANAGNN